MLLHVMLEIVGFGEAAIADRTLERPASVVAVRMAFQIACDEKNRRNRSQRVLANDWQIKRDEAIVNLATEFQG